MSEENKIGRREVIKDIAVGVGAVSSFPILNNFGRAEGHHHHVAVPLVTEAITPKAPSFFDKHQYAMITELASLIIPTDETPGAREAKVNEYIDMIVGESAFDVKKIYLDGLAWLDKTSVERHNKKFIDLTNNEQVVILTEISQIKDPTPENEVQAKFFKAIKNITIDGFYTSKIGIEELGYIGNTVLDEFPGCTHREHQS
jgi:gluconate 2-dehydrogenase gamma chain